MEAAEEFQQLRTIKYPKARNPQIEDLQSVHITILPCGTIEPLQSSMHLI